MRGSVAMKITKNQIRKIILREQIRSNVRKILAEEKVLRIPGDNTYEYKFEDHWWTRKQGADKWISLKNNTAAANALNKKFPKTTPKVASDLSKAKTEDETAREDEASPGFASKLLKPILKAVTDATIRAGTTTFPIYVIGFALFLSGKTSAFTGENLSKAYKIALAGMAKYAIQNYGGSVGGGDLSAYKTKYTEISSAMGESGPGSPLIGNEDILKGAGLVEDYMYFLGQFNAKEVGDYYIITDGYDFNNFKDSKEYYTKIENAWPILKEGIKKIY
jgi:hypothetical protein